MSLSEEEVRAIDPAYIPLPFAIPQYFKKLLRPTEETIPMPEDLKNILLTKPVEWYSKEQVKRVFKTLKQGGK
jgi:hypothetical protein